MGRRGWWRVVGAVVLLVLLAACPNDTTPEPAPPATPPPTEEPTPPPGTTRWEYTVDYFWDVLWGHKRQWSWGGSFLMGADGQVITTTTTTTFTWWDDAWAYANCVRQPEDGETLSLTLGVGGGMVADYTDPTAPTPGLMLRFWNPAQPPVCEFPAREYQETYHCWDERGEYYKQGPGVASVACLDVIWARLNGHTAARVLEFGDPSWTYSRIVHRAVCTAGCVCDSDAECDDREVCTRDQCLARQCVHTPDDTVVPPQVAGDCRRCQEGQVYSVREEVESECERIRRETVATCAEGNRNWIVHWVAKTGGGEVASHYCQAGEVPATSGSGICDGAGQCPQGQPVTFLEGAVSRACQSPGSGNVELACNVFCTRCR